MHVKFPFVSDSPLNCCSNSGRISLHNNRESLYCVHLWPITTVIECRTSWWWSKSCQLVMCPMNGRDISAPTDLLKLSGLSNSAASVLSRLKEKKAACRLEGLNGLPFSPFTPEKPELPGKPGSPLRPGRPGGPNGPRFPLWLLAEPGTSPVHTHSQHITQVGVECQPRCSLMSWRNLPGSPFSPLWPSTPLAPGVPGIPGTPGFPQYCVPTRPKSSSSNRTAAVQLSHWRA